MKNLSEYLTKSDSEGNCITVISKSSSDAICYKVTKAKKGNCLFVSALVGYGEKTFRFLGYMDQNLKFQASKMSKVFAETTEFKTFSWLLNNIDTDKMDNQCIVKRRFMSVSI